MPENSFNLINEPWIPVTNEGLKSLREIFKGEGAALGGTPREKIALLKLLQAIAQAAATPKDKEEWRTLGAKKMGEKCIAYLDEYFDNFYLYGEKPFLQMPVRKAEKKSYGFFLPQVSSGNTSRLTDLQRDFPLSDAGRALLLVCEMSMCLGGKKPDNKFKLGGNETKKSASAAPGPGMCSFGLQHTFLWGESVLETIWLNLMDEETISTITELPLGLGTPPWEEMPENENCSRAEALKNSLMGRLVPLARYCLLEEDGMHVTEGIIHPNYLSGIVDPSASVNREKSKYKMLWIDPEKRPWRNLSAMLGFLDREKANGKFDCLNLKEGLKRLVHTVATDNMPTRAHIWCGGFKVSSNAGEQYASGNDDSVESDFTIDLKDLDEDWYGAFSREMLLLDKYARHLYGCVNAYLASQKMNEARADAARNQFWDKSENYFQELLDICEDEEAIKKLDNKLKKVVFEIYDAECPHSTSRQMDAWAAHRPFRKKLDPETKSKKEKETDA